MKEIEYPKIEIVGEAPSKKDYCSYPLDPNTIFNLIALLFIEQRLETEEMSVRDREGCVLAHTLIWSTLPDKYKSELADLTAITA